jgi:hypothetical protein
VNAMTGGKDMSLGWYTVVAANLTDARVGPWPRGPWRTRLAAEAALRRWRAKPAAGLAAAVQLAVVGPFPTRAAARQERTLDGWWARIRIAPRDRSGL